MSYEREKSLNNVREILRNAGAKVIFDLNDDGLRQGYGRILYMQGWATRRGVVIVQYTYTGHQRVEDLEGWDVYLPCDTSNRADATFESLKRWLAEGEQG